MSTGHATLAQIAYALPPYLGIADPWPSRRDGQCDLLPRWSASATVPASPAPRPSGKCSTITPRNSPACRRTPPPRSPPSSIAGQPDGVSP